jgi:hypothetical protein
MNATVSFHKLLQVLRRRAVPALAVVTLLAAGALPALAQLSRTMTVEVPFAFVAGKKTLPAGTYAVRPMASNVIVFADVNGGPSSIVVTTAADATASLGRSEVRFNRYGDAYYLAEVRPAAATQFLSVPRTRDEARLARSTPNPEVVALEAARAR